MNQRPFDHAATVSGVRGRWQIPALTWVTRVLLAAALAGTLLPGGAGVGLRTAVVATVVAVPLLRVAWLVGRWSYERDRVFVAVGVGLLAVVGGGALLTLL